MSSGIIEQQLTTHLIHIISFYLIYDHLLYCMIDMLKVEILLDELKKYYLLTISLLKKKKLFNK